MTKKLRAVDLPDWRHGKGYRDRHPQGVIYYREGFPGDFGVWKSSKTADKAIQAAGDLNKDLSGFLRAYGWETTVFEAVTFNPKTS